MNNIARFFTIYWCIYFPTCIAYNELPGFSSIDEVMTGIIVLYTYAMKKKWANTDVFQNNCISLQHISLLIPNNLWRQH